MDQPNPNQPRFPNYPAPKPTGTPIVDPKQSNHLWKLARFMMKPKLRAHTPFHVKPKKHKVKFH